jgi:hypothetical protein
MAESYETHAKGVRILPGQWRPHYPFEQVAWVSPAWPSQDYLWLDFPEAIFGSLGLLYLSHVNPAFPTLFADLERVAWRSSGSRLAFERRLPNEVVFGGALALREPSAVEMTLFIRNGTQEPLTDIKLQTCVFLRAIKEFSAFTMGNKVVHVPGRGWVPCEAARGEATADGRTRLGWRGGPQVADLPVIVTLSDRGERMVGMTWYEHTYSLIGNPNHPCMHADPFFPDLEPGQEAEIRGELLFYEGDLAAFGAWFAERQAASSWRERVVNPSLR